MFSRFIFIIQYIFFLVIISAPLLIPINLSANNDILIIRSSKSGVNSQMQLGESFINKTNATLYGMNWYEIWYEMVWSCVNNFYSSAVQLTWDNCNAIVIVDTFYHVNCTWLFTAWLTFNGRHFSLLLTETAASVYVCAICNCVKGILDTDFFHEIIPSCLLCNQIYKM